MKKVMIGIPVQDGKTTIQFNNSLIMEFLKAITQDIILCPIYSTGGSIIPLARNAIVSEFFASDYDELVFIDADEGWEAGAVCKMVSHPVDMIVGGSVRLKQDEEKYAVQWIHDLPGDRKLAAANHGLMEVGGIGTGFMRLSRHVIEALIKKHPELSYTDGGCTLGMAWALFDNKLHNGRYYGEDMWFCHIARQAGFGIYVDPYLEFSHTGNKTYTGSLATVLRAGLPKTNQEIQTNLSLMEVM